MVKVRDEEGYVLSQMLTKDHVLRGHRPERCDWCLITITAIIRNNNTPLTEILSLNLTSPKHVPSYILLYLSAPFVVLIEVTLDFLLWVLVWMAREVYIIYVIMSDACIFGRLLRGLGRWA